ncbi:MAG TPA: cytochrome b N-terminal domain-containing protein [Longimicrobiales bacterium]|nr:cytochrome b N-terminal domain-containing protein [Longimicrobiales bacterium]
MSTAEYTREAAPGQAPTELPARGWRARFALDALRYPVAPMANRVPYMLGGLTFFGILLLVATGVLLDQFYNPAPLGAHDSVVYIVTRVPLGWWLRALHYWGASLVLVSVFLHLVWTFSRRSYRAPREVQWWSGVLLLLLLFAIAFTGTVLRGDQEGGEALAHAVAGGSLVGPVGAPVSPDFAPSTSLLARVHNAHVSLLPLALLALIALHFWLVRWLGIHTAEARTSTFARHLRRLGGFALLLYGAISILAALAPPRLGYPAVEGVEVTKPFWPFLWIYTFENTLGMTGMIVAPLVVFGALAIVPLVDRRPDAAGGRPRWIVAAAVAFLALFLGTLLYGAVAPQIAHLGM